MSAATTRPRTPEQVIEQIARLRLGVDLDGTPADLGEAKRLAALRAALFDAYAAGQQHGAQESADQRERAQQALLREFLAGGDF